MNKLLFAVTIILSYQHISFGMENPNNNGTASTVDDTTASRTINKTLYERAEQHLNQEYGEYEGEEKYVQLFELAKKKMGMKEWKNIFLRCNDNLYERTRSDSSCTSCIVNKNPKNLFHAIAFDSHWFEFWGYTSEQILASFGHELAHAQFEQFKEESAEQKEEEKKADIAAAKALNCARATAENFRLWKALEDFGAKLDTQYHPSPKERIEYLEGIADEQNEPPVTKVDWKACIQDKLQKGVIELREGRTIFRKLPLTVGEDAYTAAGSTIPNDIPPNAQQIKEFVQKLRAKE